jgi:hypothetical protein
MESKLKEPQAPRRKLAQITLAQNPVKQTSSIQSSAYPRLLMMNARDRTEAHTSISDGINSVHGSDAVANSCTLCTVVLLIGVALSPDASPSIHPGEASSFLFVLICCCKCCCIGSCSDFCNINPEALLKMWRHRTARDKISDSYFSEAL